jgi:hypothetical protein
MPEHGDIVGRSIPSHLRSRMLAWRFFGGGLFAVAVAAFIHRVLGTFPLLPAYSSCHNRAHRKALAGRKSVQSRIGRKCETAQRRCRWTVK